MCHTYCVDKNNIKEGNKMDKLREELDIEQFKIKFAIDRIRENLDWYKYGGTTLKKVKEHIDIIKKELGI
jgi:hypothetical protein